MSLEAMMKELAAALDRNTAALGGKAAPAAPAATGGKGKDTKPKITQDQLAEKANALKEKSGMPAVREIFTKVGGAKTGKMGEVAEAKYADVAAAIDAALEGEPAAAEDDSL